MNGMGGKHTTGLHSAICLRSELCDIRTQVEREPVQGLLERAAGLVNLNESHSGPVKL